MLSSHECGEAGFQTKQGQVARGSVVMNRDLREGEALAPVV
jgi:spore germination cell wall hydrolase CwlJ-like protein